MKWTVVQNQSNFNLPVSLQMCCCIHNFVQIKRVTRPLVAWKIIGLFIFHTAIVLWGYTVLVCSFFFFFFFFSFVLQNNFQIIPWNCETFKNGLYQFMKRFNYSTKVWLVHTKWLKNYTVLCLHVYDMRNLILRKKKQLKLKRTTILLYYGNKPTNGQNLNLYLKKDLRFLKVN